PPKFVKGQGQNVSIAGTQVVVTFDIRTHTNMTTGCHLTPLDAETVQRATDCSHVWTPAFSAPLSLHGRRHVSARQPSIELDVIERRSLAREGDGSAQSAHIYWDADPPASDGVDAAEETPPPARHRPGNPPADYLNPEPSRDETEEEAAEFNTVPFYQNAQIRNTGASGAAAESSQAVAINNSPPTATAASEYGNGQVEDRTDDNQRTGSADTETDETGYMKYAPRLYENTGP
ncbi:hypothetical protein BaRGS_00024572, partial [Batillaria attramentaria]